jgi:membrane fusion protein, multidrug efflux system
MRFARRLHHWDELTGELQAVNTVEVHPRVSGFIDSVQFTESARVGKGQSLFQIDPRPFQIEIERLSAELRRAQSKLDCSRNARLHAALQDHGL